MRLYELDTQGHGQRWIDLDSITQVDFTPKGNPDPPPTLKLTIGPATIDVLTTKNMTEIIFILGLAFQVHQAPV